MSSMGTLSVDLVAKTGGFDKSLKQAQKRTETFDRKMRRFSRNMNRHFSDIARSAKQLGVGLAGVSVAIGAVLKSQADMVKRANESAKAIGVATGQLQAFQFAASKVGIESDKAADILKDLSDKVGDVALTGGGELAAPLEKLGLSASNLAKMKPVQMLTEIGNAISGLPDAQQVNILESMADEGSRLRPLLQDNAGLLRQYTQRARELNLANSRIDVQKILAFWRAWDRVKDAITGLARTATIHLAPALADAADQMQRFIKQSGDSGKIKGFFDTLDDKLSHIKDTLSDIAKFGSNALIAKLFGLSTATVAATAQIAGSSSGMGRRLQSGNPTRSDLGSLSTDRLSGLRQMYEKRARDSTQHATAFPLGSKQNEAAQKAADKYWEAAQMIDRAMAKGPLKIDITQSANDPESGGGESGGRSGSGGGAPAAVGMTEAEQRHLQAMQKSQDKYREWLGLQEQRKQGINGLIQQFGTREQAAQAWYQSQVQRIRNLAGESQLADELIASAHEQMVERMNAGANEMSVYARRAAENIQDAFADLSFDPFSDGLEGMLKGFVDTLRRMAAEQASSALFGGGGKGSGLLGTAFGAIKTGVGAYFGGGATANVAGSIGGDAPLSLGALSGIDGAFANAPRYHSGGMVGAGEVPAILKRGEGVFTKQQMANLAPAGGTSVNVKVTYKEAPGKNPDERKQDHQSFMRQLQQAIDSRVGSRINEMVGNGEFDEAMAPYNFGRQTTVT